MLVDRRRTFGPTAIGFWAMGLMLCVSFTATASDLKNFNDAVAKAFTHYRGALFYLRRGNADPAGFELELFKDAWGEIEKKWAATPPDAFAGDPQWNPTFPKIEAIVDAGFGVMDKDGPKAAREAIKPIRALLSSLRRRNGVYTYSDCIDELNAQMKKVWPYRRNPPDFRNLAEVNKVKMEASVYEYLLKKCRKQASDKLQKSVEFNRMFDAAANSVQMLWDATDKKQRRRFINILRELRPFDRLIFLRFG
jgi:hypothetical protein